MIDNLKHLKAFALTSKLTGRIYHGYDSRVEDDLTRLKKGVRANHNLNWSQAWYNALSKVGLLDTFRALCSKAGEPQLCGSFKTLEENCIRQAKYYEGLSNPDLYKRNIRQQLAMADVYRFLRKYDKEAVAEYGQLKLNKSKLVDWSDLTVVQGYQYDAATNSFVEFEHTPEKKKK